MSGVTIVADLPLISEHFSSIENIDFLSKLLLTIPSIMVALFAPFAGMLIDKIGRLQPLYSGIILFVIGGSSGFYLDNFYLILVGRALLGLSVALIMTASLALVGDYFHEKERHKFMSTQGMFVGLSGIVFILSGGFLAELSWKEPFLIYMLPILFLPLLVTTLKEPKNLHFIAEEEIPLKVNLFPVYITGFFSMLLFYMLPTQLPYLITNELGGTPSITSYFIASSMLVTATVSKQYHHLKERLSFAQIFMLVYLFFALGLFTISQANTLHQLFLAPLFMGGGFGLVTVNINTWLLSLVHAKKRGRAVGLLTSSFFFGQFFSPIIFEPIIKTYHIQGLFFIISILSLVIVITIYLKLFMTNRKTSES